MSPEQLQALHWCVGLICLISQLGLMHLLGMIALRDPICASKLLSVFADGEALPPESLEDRLAEVSSPYGGLEGLIETLALVLQREGRLLWLSIQT